MSLMICRGHIRVSKSALKFFLWLTVVCENGHFIQILHFVEISWLVQVLLNFTDSGGPPPGGGRWVDGGWGWVWVCGGVSQAHTQAHACTCTHARSHMHVEHDKHAKHGCLHVSGHLHFLYTYTCMYVCVHACMCMCVCVGTPPMPPPDASRHPPCTCPLPRATGSPKHQNSISPELIEIIRFCLKILYLWTLLSSYKL